MTPAERERLARDMAEHIFTEIRASREPDPMTVDELAALLLAGKIPCIACWSDAAVSQGMRLLHDPEPDTQ